MQYTKNSYSVKGFHYAIQISFTNMESSIWKLVPFNEGKKFSNKEKYNAKAGDESKAKKKKLWNTVTKDLEDKCLGAIHKIKSVICIALPWIYTHFTSIQIFYLSQ